MKCQKCSYELPGDSVFCPYCGAPVDQASTGSDASESASKPIRSGRSGSLVLPILAVILILALAGTNVYQYISYKDAAEAYESEISQMASFAQTQMNQFEAQIASQKTTIAQQKEKISELTKKAGYYSTICSQMSNAKVGYGSSAFFVDNAVVVLKQSEKNIKITLTTAFNDDVGISVNYSSPCAYLSFDEGTWYGKTTTLTVVPCSQGVTVATFSNDINSVSFKVLIIVTG